MSEVTCVDCGMVVTNWGLHLACRRHPVPHIHIWHIDRVEHGVSEWAGGPYITPPHDVAYLVCACGVTKKSVPA
jgi:hypothetical protein